MLPDNRHQQRQRRRPVTPTRASEGLGALATQSFHATKNVSCGEGGALVLNAPGLVQRAEIIREKGTNRSQFFRGVVDKYRWVDIGSSYLPSDVVAALLTAQLEAFDEIQSRRHAIWDTYARDLASWARDTGAQLPVIPDGCEHAAHVFQVLLPTAADRTAFIDHMRTAGVMTPFHYVPLHSSPAGERFGREGPGGCEVTTDIADRLVRLPLFARLASLDLARVVEAAVAFRPA